MSTARYAALALIVAATVPVAADSATIGGTLAWAASNPDAKAASPWIPVLVRFAEAPSPAHLEEMEREDLLRWRRHAGQVLGATTVFLARTTADRLERLAQHPALLRVEADGSPVRLATLDATAVEIGATRAWRRTAPGGGRLTGSGVLIADLDTGIDPFHPALRRYGPTPVAWFDPDPPPLTGRGYEWADLDGDGLHGMDETLRVLEADVSDSYPGGNPPGYTPGLDWVWVDVDRDGEYDPAPDGEPPGAGEPLLVGRDADGDGTLTVDEDLLMVVDSKVAAVRGLDGRVFRRGVDLAEVPVDTWGHGTPVAGILVGGEPGVTRLTGVAPDAELIVGMIAYEDEPRFWRTMPEMAAWAAAEGADVILVEDGEWVWEFMDGSSAGELLLTELARDQGIVVLTAAGNLAGGGQHARKTVPGYGAVTFSAGDAGYGKEGPDVLWLNFNWRGPLDAVRFTLEGPAGSVGGDALTYAVTTLTDAVVESFGDQSTAGTSMLALQIRATADGLPVGFWSVTLTSSRPRPMRIDAAKWDSLSGWAGYWRFQHPSDDGTVTWPGTAHGVIVVAGYDGRGLGGFPVGDLNSFSGRGAALDGRRLVDIAAPGSPTFSASGGSHGWQRFGGTSAALPHVAGACALLRQSDPQATPSEIALALAASARRDANTGVVPNNTWGFGRLDVPAAIDALKEIRRGGIPVLEPVARRSTGRVGP